MATVSTATKQSTETKQVTPESAAAEALKYPNAGAHPLARAIDDDYAYTKYAKHFYGLPYKVQAVVSVIESHDIDGRPYHLSFEQIGREGGISAKSAQRGVLQAVKLGCVRVIEPQRSRTEGHVYQVFMPVWLKERAKSKGQGDQSPAKVIGQGDQGRETILQRKGQRSDQFSSTWRSFKGWTERAFMS